MYVVPAVLMCFFLTLHVCTCLASAPQVDVENPDLLKFPLFSRATSMEYILHPGQMLYIPPQCWHYIRSLDISFSVSFWWKWADSVVHHYWLYQCVFKEQLNFTVMYISNEWAYLLVDSSVLITLIASNVVLCQAICGVRGWWTWD